MTENSFEFSVAEQEKKPKKVARIFIFQSISPESIPEEADPRELTFTRQLFILKSGKKSADLLIPVGGQIKPGEEIADAAKRELVEETHLRATPESTRELPTQHKYSFTLPDGETINNEVHYSVGRIMPSPMDKPFPLDNDEDKIAEFVSVSYDEYLSLIEEGSIVKNEKKLQFIDSLRPTEKTVDISKLTNDFEAVKTIHESVKLEFQRINADKRLSVLEHAIWGSRIKGKSGNQNSVDSLHKKRLTSRKKLLELREKLGNLNSNPEEMLTNIATANQFWIASIDEFNLKIHDLQIGLKNSNIESVRRFSTVKYDKKNGSTTDSKKVAKHGHGIPTLSLVFPLLYSDSPDLRERRTLIKNPELKKLLHIADTMYHLRVACAGNATAEQIEKSDKIIRNRLKLSEDAEITTTQVLDYLIKKGYIPEQLSDAERLSTLSHVIDGFFENIKHHAHEDTVPLDQHEGIKNKKDDTGLKILERLFDIATNRAPAMKSLNPDEQKIYRWEAQRKLLLLMMLDGAKQAIDRIQSNGIEPIENIENDCIKILSEKHYHTHGETISAALAGEDFYYNITVHKRKKELLSLLRKIIVRDEAILPELTNSDVTRDFFAESYVFNDDNPKLLENTVFIAPPNKFYDNKNINIQTFTAPKAVGNLIMALFQSAEKRGDNIKIVDYKPLPKPGENFKSGGAGGGGKIRLAKFYIKHTDQAGTVRFREVQIFLPHILDPENLSTIVGGDHDFKVKKKDDESYGLKRLFATKGLRSFMELLFPAEIYGDQMRQIFKKVKQ